MISSQVAAKPSRAVEVVELCSVTKAPSSFSGHRIAFEADVLADGVHGSVLISPACQRGIDPDFSKAEAAGKEYGKAIFTGRRGTIDKDIHARFSGIFLLVPWDKPLCKEGRMMSTTKPCFILQIESMTDLRITFKPGQDPTPPNRNMPPPIKW